MAPTDTKKISKNFFHREIISDAANIAPYSAHWIFARDCKTGGEGRLYQIGTVISDGCSTTHSNWIEKKNIYQPMKKIGIVSYLL